MTPAIGQRPRADRCGWCGRAATLHANAPDSSYLDPVDPAGDGRRPVAACNPTHMTQVSAALQRRPFHYPELWAGRIARIQAAHPRDMGLEDLARESGLTIAQLEQAALWAGRAAVPRVASHALPSTGHTDGSGHTDDSTAVDGW